MQARGLNFGVDIGGGSRTILNLEVSQVTIETTGDDMDSAWNSIRSVLKNNLNTTVNLVAQYPAERRIVVEIGESVSTTFVQNMVSGLGTVIGVVENATQEIRDNTISKLQARVDPYGLLGTSLRTLGDNQILFETTQMDDRTRELLTKRGGLEVLIENQLVLTDEDIASFVAPASAGAIYSSIHVYYTEEGSLKLKTAAEGKTSVPGVVYLDRPTDAILLFNETVLGELSALVYDNGTWMFRSTTAGEYSLLVPAVGTSLDNLSTTARDYLQSQAGAKLRVLLLGNMEDFANVVGDIPAGYQLESVPKLSNETKDKWIKRACGIISDITVGLGIGSNRIVVESNLQDARTLRTVLSDKLPANVSFESEAAVGAYLGDGFMQEVLLAGAVAGAAVFLLLYLRYRRWKIGLTILGTSLCELAIALGAASASGLTIGLPELAGLFVVVGTGIDHMLIVTDEMLRGGMPQDKGVSVGWRASRALKIVYTAMFAIIGAMVPVALIGFGAIRGFVILTISGTVLALIFTRTLYARIVDTVLAS